MTRLALLLGLLLAPQAARADLLTLAGGSKGATSEYAFAGAVVPLLRGSIGTGPAVRLWGDYLTYSYAGPAGTTTASGWGGALAGVYQFSGDWGWANLSAGAAFRDTVLSAPDPGNRQQGSKIRATLQAEGGYNITPQWRMRGLAGYLPEIGAYSFQAGIDRTVWGEMRLGLTAAFQGDDNYSQEAGGVIAFIPLGGGMELAPSVGVSHGSGTTAAYGSLTLVAFLD